MPRRHWLRFSLRSVFVLLIIVGVWLGLATNKVRRQREAVRAVQRLAGVLLYDYQLKDGLLVADAEMPGTEWLRNAIGEDYFRTVVWFSAFESGANDDDLQAVESFTELRSLNLVGNPFTDKGVRSIGQLRQLESLDLGECPNVTDAGLEHLKSLSKLKSLSVRNTAVTSNGMKAISDLKNLEWLDLSGLPLTDAGIEQLESLPTLKYLCICHPGELELRPHSVTVAAAARFKRALPNCRVDYEDPDKREGIEARVRQDEEERKKYEDAIKQRIEQGFQITSREQFLAALKEINRSVREFRDSGMYGDMTAFLDLANLSVDDTFLSHVRFLPELDGLSLGRNPISDSGLKPISALRGLRYISLWETNVTDAGLVHLVGLKGLRSLDLAHLNISDVGLEQVKNLSALEYLSLIDTKITDAGLRNLSGLTNLKRLYLVRTAVTDAGLVHLENLKKLQWLDLSGTGVTEEGMYALQPSMPKCRIELWINAKGR